MPVQIIVPAIFGAAGIANDITQHKICNTITYPLILSALAWQAYHNGAYGAFDAIAAIVITLIVTGVVPLFRMGGGDRKLMAGLAAFTGLQLTPTFLLMITALITAYNLLQKSQKEGIKSVGQAIYLEIITRGVEKDVSEKQIGAPFIVVAYILTWTLSKGGLLL